MTDWPPHNLASLSRRKACYTSTTNGCHSVATLKKEKSKALSKSTTIQHKRTKKINDRKECLNKPKKRERTRQDNVNIAFGQLRDILPTYPHDKKLSKCQILRLAVRYITLLNNVLQELERKPSLHHLRENTC